MVMSKNSSRVRTAEEIVDGTGRIRCDHSAKSIVECTRYLASLRPSVLAKVIKTLEASKKEYAIIKRAERATARIEQKEYQLQRELEGQQHKSNNGDLHIKVLP